MGSRAPSLPGDRDVLAFLVPSIEILPVGGWNQFVMPAAVRPVGLVTLGRQRTHGGCVRVYFTANAPASRPHTARLENSRSAPRPYIEGVVAPHAMQATIVSKCSWTA